MKDHLIEIDGATENFQTLELFTVMLNDKK